MVDWVSLPYRRGPRDLTGAGFAPEVDAIEGDSEAGAAVGEEGCSMLVLVQLSVRQPFAATAHTCLLLALLCRLG